MNATTFPLNRPRTLPVAITALLAGAALSAGVIAIADSEEIASSPAKVIVVDAPPSEGLGTKAKDEAAVAAAIAAGPELRGSKASALGSAPSASAPQPDESQPDESRPAGPRGLAAGWSR
jgi:hypothetical protein